MKKNNRTEAWRNAKRINNLPRYDLGTPSVNRGFLLGASRVNNVSEYEIKPGIGLDNEIEDVKSNTIPNAIQGVTAMLPMTAGLILGAISGGGSAAANIGSGVTHAVVNNTLNTSSQIARLGILSIGDTAAEGATAGSSAASGALSVGTKVLGGIGAAYGLYNMADYLFSSKRGISDSLMMDTVSRNREFSHGVGYDTYGNVNLGQVNQLGSAILKSDAVSQSLGGASTGAAIGSFFTPLGTAIGAGIGALTGLFSGIFGGRKKKRKMLREAELTNQAIARYNKQSEADAASEGIKREFYDNHLPTQAKYGIDSSTKVNPGTQHPKYAMVETPEGVLPGPVKSIVGKGEGLINFNNGTASMVETGTTGKDTNYASIDPNDKNQVVLSNSIPVPGTNTTIAQAAEPYIRMLPYAQNIEKMAIMNKLADYTNLLASLKSGNLKQFIPHYKGGTPSNTPRWWLNKELWSNIGNYGMMLAPLIIGLLGLRNQNRRIKNARSWVPNTYAENEEGRRALDILANRRYRPYAQLNALNDATRGILWSTNQAGALSSGQREKIKNSAILNSAALAAAIYDKADDINNKYLGDYANMSFNIGTLNAPHRQNNEQWRFGIQQQQNANREIMSVDNDASRYKMVGAGIKDVRDMINYKKALDLLNRMIGIYKSNADNETARTNAYINGLRNTQQIPQEDYRDLDTEYLRWLQRYNVNPFTGERQTTAI